MLFYDIVPLNKIHRRKKINFLKIFKPTISGWLIIIIIISLAIGGVVKAAPPATPTLISPTNGSTIGATATSTITFQWSASAGATIYWLEVNTDPAWGAGTRFYYADVTNVTSKAVPGFTNKTTYYWRVWAGNGDGWSAPTAGWSFILAWTDTGGGDHNGADWTPANGATICGVHTNIGTFTITSGYTVNVCSGTALDVTATTANIAGILNAATKGYGSGQGTGHGVNVANGLGRGRSGGGGYGGAGGAGVDTAGGGTYGSSTAPTDLGSGGGNTGDCWGPNGLGGGTGGGAVKLNISGTTTILGQINANGGVGLNAYPTYPCAGGGGSGGSIYIITGVLAGSGTTTATGGNGGYSTAGGGGGGRIKLQYCIDLSSILKPVSGGSGNVSGSSGSLSTSTQNCVPDMPTSLTQYKSDCTTTISTGGWTNETSVCLKGYINDTNANDQVKLRVEATTGSFTNAPTATSTSFCTDPCTASTSVIGLSSGSQYKWQGQSIDDDNATSSWAQFNSGSTAFGVDASTPDIVAVDAGASSTDRTSLTSNTLFGYSDTGYDDQISFSWTDPNSASNDTFYYELNADSGNTITGDESTTSNPYIDNITISEGTSYFHARPKNGAGTWGAERTFIVIYDKTIPPVVSNISLNGSNNITLNENTTKSVSATGTVSDGSGYSNITSVMGKIYRSGVGNSCSVDNNNCYSAAVCATSSCSGNDCTATCNYNVYFYADPTDTGNYASSSGWSSQSWIAWIKAIDASNASSSATNSAQTIDVNTLTALQVDTSITYDTLNPNQNMASTSKTVNATNTGNVPIDIQIKGDDMAYGATGTIAIANQKYATSAVAWASGNVASSSYVTLNVDMGKPTSSPSTSTDIIYWGWAVPSGTPVGTYTGVDYFNAVETTTGRGGGYAEP